MLACHLGPVIVTSTCHGILKLYPPIASSFCPTFAFSILPNYCALFLCTWSRSFSSSMTTAFFANGQERALDDSQRLRDRYHNGYSRTTPSQKQSWKKFNGRGIQWALSQLFSYTSLFKRFVRRQWAGLPLSSRRPSLSSNVAVDNVQFVLLCALWYSSSALSSNTGKAILVQFRYPVTLTFVQFGFIVFYCLMFMTPVIGFSKLRYPTQAILRDTLPMGIFQVVGHMFSSIAIARIPVSTVHTIKVPTYCYQSELH